RIVRPHVEVAGSGPGLRAAGALEPWVLVRRVVDDQLGDDAQAARVGLTQKALEVRHRAVSRMDLRVVGDVVAVVAPRRWIEWEQPDRRDAEVLQVIELLA